MQAPGEHAVDLGGHGFLLRGTGLIPAVVKERDNVHVVVVPKLSLPEPAGGIVEILNRQCCVEHERKIRNLALEVGNDVKGHAEIVGEILAPVAKVALSPISGCRIAVAA